MNENLTDFYNPDRIKKVQQEFPTIGCAQLRDSAPDYTHVLHLPLIARNPQRKRMAGPVFPVTTENDMLPCLQALNVAPPGAILFIQNTIEPDEALAGDVFISFAIQKSLGGLIVNGAIRDIDFIGELDFPVFSRSVTYVSARTTRKAADQIPCSVKLDLLLMEPGDWIFADSDGLLLIKRRFLSAVFSGALVLRRRERQFIEAIQGGGTLDELCGLADFLAGRGELRFDL